MKEDAIEKRYYATSANNRKFTYEEIKNPEYPYWGRARYWYLHQALCLLAGLIPLEKSAVTCLLRSTSPLRYIDLFQYYPIHPQDVTLLKNILNLLSKAINNGHIRVEKDQKEECLFRPLDVVEWAKSLDGLRISPQLIEVVLKQGPTQSLALPATFIDDSNPTILQNFKKIKRHLNSPLHLHQSTEEKLEDQKTQSANETPKRARKLRPDQLHKAQYQAIVTKILSSSPNLDYAAMGQQSDIIQFFQNCQDAEGEFREYSPKTIKKWFREIKKYGRGRPRKLAINTK